MRIECDKPTAVVMEAFWLAWQACGRPQGMGFLQDNPSATRDDVWKNVSEAGDYPFKDTSRNNPCEAYGDYVFGRMMKLGINWDDTSVTVSDAVPDIEYQAWCGRYQTYQDLVNAAIAGCRKPEPATA